MTTPRTAQPAFTLSAPVAETEAVYQLVKRSALNPSDVEDTSANAVEITVLWERSVLHVAHLNDAQGFSLVDHTSLDDGSRFVVDGAVLGCDEAPIVARDGGATRFVFMPGAQGEVELDGVRRDLATLIAEGIARPSSSVHGAHEIGVVVGGRYRMEFAGLTVMARMVPVGRRFAEVTRKDPVLRRALGGSVLAMAAFLGLMRVASQESGMLMGEDRDARLAELRDFVARQSEQIAQAEPQEAAAAADAPAGAAHQGAAGAMGNRQSNAHNRRYDIQRTGERPHLARELSARETVANRGIFAALGGTTATSQGSHSGIVSPWGEMTEAGTGDRNANGNINGADVGDSFGMAGLDTVGTGVGGGGHDVGVGTGPLGTLGNGSCPPGERCEYGRTRGTLTAAPRATHGPVARPATPDIMGQIAPEAIRRVVLRNIGQVNRCYEQGLSINATAQGRVSVRFVIAGGGAVLMTAVAEDHLGMPSVSGCIANAVRRWTFPVPESSGPVTVTYPFNLMPADQ